MNVISAVFDLFRDSSTSRADDRYTAFISYSHQADDQLTKSLQRGLERLAKPWYKPRLIRVFRDITNLAASPSLRGSIEAALAASEWLILIASPAAARSEWVVHEVNWWLTNKSSENLLIALTDGEYKILRPGSPEQDSAALPPPLESLADEPKWIDLRPLKGLPELDESQPLLHERILDLGSAIHGMPRDALGGMHVTERQRTKVLVRRVIAGLSFLLVVALTLAATTFIQLQEAQRQQRIAIARLLVNEAQSLIVTDPRTSLRLAEAAQHLSDSPENRTALARLARSTRYRGTLSGHQGTVTAVQFTPRGNILSAVGYDGFASLWDAASPTQPRQLGSHIRGQKTSLDNVVISADGKLMFTSAYDGTIAIWNVADPARPSLVGQPIASADAGRPSLTLSPDGRLVARLDLDGSVAMWEVTDPAHPRAVDGQIPTRGVSIEFSPTGRTLAVGTEDGNLQLWDTADQSRPRMLGTYRSPVHDKITRLAFAPGGQVLAMVQDHIGVSLLDITDVTRPHISGDPLPSTTSSPVSQLAFVPRGKALAMATLDGNIQLVDLTSRHPVKGFMQPNVGRGSSVFALSVSADGSTLASGGGDGNITLWDISDSTAPEHLSSIPVPNSGNSRITGAFSADSKSLLLGAGGEIRSWDVTDPARPAERGTVVPSRGQKLVEAVTPDGALLVTAGADELAVRSVADVDGVRLVGKIDGIPTATAESISTSPDEAVVALAHYNGTLSLWGISDPAHPSALGTLSGLRGTVNSVSLASDGKLVASSDGNPYKGNGDPPAGYDGNGTVLMWDIHDSSRPRQIGQPLTGHRGRARYATFTPDGRTLAYANNDFIYLWNVADPANPTLIEGSVDDGQPVLGLAVSPDNHILAAASAAGITLWDISDLTRPTQRIGATLTYGADSQSLPTGQLLAFSPDGRTLVGAEPSGSVGMWTVEGARQSTLDPIDQACRESGGGLDSGEWSRFVDGLSFEDSCASTG